MSEWKEYKLGELAFSPKKAIISGPFGSNIGSRFFVPKGIPVIRGNNLPNDMRRFYDDGFVFLTKEKADELNCYAIKDDLLFTAAGTIGQVGILTGVEKYIKYVISNKQIRVRLNTNIVNPLFAYYWFSTTEMNTYIKNRNTGSTIPLINLSVIKDLPIKLPDLTIQNEIVEILSSLDDKIELNNKINQELKSLAHLLFKELCGNEEDLKNNTNAIKLKEVLIVKNGYAFKGMDFIASGIPVIKIKNVKASLINFNNLSFVSSEVASKAKKHKINKFDLLITMSGNRIDGSIDSWVGKVAMFPKEGDFLLNQRVSKLEAYDEKHKYFLLELLSSEDFQNYFISNATSSGGQANISPDLIYNTEVVLPPIESLNKFHESSKIIHSIIFNNMAENEKLVELRDILLPKLISGELQINDN